VEYGVISDVHANVEALDAVFACLDRAHVDRVSCLGDIVDHHAHAPLPLTRCSSLLVERRIVAS
jgi:predicted phosphodiesterase